MNQQAFMMGAAVSVIYFLCKFLEMKFILKEEKPLKKIFRDTLIVFISVIAGNYLLSYVNPGKTFTSPEVFTTDPDF